MEIQALDTLRDLLRNTSATWTSDGQRSAVLATLEWSADVLALLSTGSGKTMIPIIASRLEPHNTVVVIVPLRSLLMDYERKLNKMKIGYYVFEANRCSEDGFPYEHNLILAVIDQARTPTWNTYIQNLHSLKPVKRIVIDEIHYMLTNDNFRPSLESIYALRVVPCQFILLSGTVPPDSVETLRKGCLLSSNSILIRTGSIRPELQYVYTAPFKRTQDLLAYVLKLVNTYQTQLKERDRALIYVPYKDLGADIQSQLQCPYYTGGEESDQSIRRDMYNRWLTGFQSQDKWMVCTNAFSTGNDYPHVRIIIHAGTPKEFSEFIQSQCRAGRDYHHAIAFLLPLPESQFKFQGGVSAMHKGQRQLKDLIFKEEPQPRCIRRSITSYIDGTGGQKCTDLVGCQHCSRCETNNPTPTLTSVFHEYQPVVLEDTTGNHHVDVNGSDLFAQLTKQAHERQVAETEKLYEQANKVLELLQGYSGSCIFCLVTTDDDNDCDLDHSFQKCPSLKYKTIENRDEFLAYRHRLYYAPGSRTCFKCHVPQLSQSLHGPFQPGKDQSNCVFPDILPLLGYAIWQTLKIRVEARVHFGASWYTIYDYGKWLTRTSQGFLYSNLIRLFFWWDKRFNDVKD